jgi:hypothetical protein
MGETDSGWRAEAEIGKLMELCEEGRPGALRVVATA